MRLYLIPAALAALTLAAIASPTQVRETEQASVRPYRLLA